MRSSPDLLFLTSSPWECPPSPQERQAAPLTYWTQPYPRTHEEAEATRRKLRLRQDEKEPLEDRSSSGLNLEEFGAVADQCLLETGYPKKATAKGGVSYPMTSISHPDDLLADPH